LNTIYGYGIIFDRIIFIDTLKDNIFYKIKDGRLEKFWVEPEANFFGLYNDQNSAFIFTRDKQMICINKDINIIVKPATAKNIRDTSLCVKDKEILLKQEMKGFSD
jgi:hypothetical protein